MTGNRVLVQTMVITALVLPSAGCKRPAEKRSAPDAEALRALIEQSAVKQLPDPKVTSAQIVLTRLPGELDSAAAQTIELIQKTGGTGIRALNAGGEIEILAQIPSARASEFRRQLAPSAPTPESSSAPDGESVFLEIVITSGTSHKTK